MEKLEPELLRVHKGKSFVGVSTAVAIFNHKGKLFLAQRSENTRDEHGRWDVCGGGLKWGETIENNSRREMNEEFAVESESDLIPVGYRQAFRTDQNGHKTHWICMDSAIILNENEAKLVKINEPENFDNSGWFDLDNLPSPMHSVIDDAYIGRLKNVISDLGIDKA
jgi:ADP-ribose pyrophosphatase YjhB (NUDIX family)